MRDNTKTNIHPVVSNMIEVKLTESSEFGFLKVVETLTRMGIASEREKRLIQTAHILHRRGRYYIAHFKEMMMLDGKEANYNEADEARRNRIALMLEKWGMVDVVDHHVLSYNPGHVGMVAVLKHEDKDNWNLVQKYEIGVKKAS